MPYKFSVYSCLTCVNSVIPQCLLNLTHHSSQLPSIGKVHLTVHLALTALLIELSDVCGLRLQISYCDLPHKPHPVECSSLYSGHVRTKCIPCICALRLKQQNFLVLHCECYLNNIWHRSTLKPLQNSLEKKLQYNQLDF